MWSVEWDGPSGWRRVHKLTSREEAFAYAVGCRLRGAIAVMVYELKGNKWVRIH